MSNRTCKDCAAFSALTRECRRHAPKMVPVPSPDGKGIAALGMYPATSADKWCMEFLPPIVGVVK